MIRKTIQTSELFIRCLHIFPIVQRNITASLFRACTKLLHTIVANISLVDVLVHPFANTHSSVHLQTTNSTLEHQVPTEVCG